MHNDALVVLLSEQEGKGQVSSQLYNGENDQNELPHYRVEGISNRYDVCLRYKLTDLP